MEKEIELEGEALRASEDRRSFLKKSGLTVAGALGGSSILAACGSSDEAASDGSATEAEGGGSDAVEAAADGGSTTSAAPLELDAQDAEVVEWDMTTSWPAGLATLYGAEDNNSGALAFARNVGLLTGGNFVINTFQAGDLAGPLEVVDVIQAGAVQAGHTASYYYRGLGETFLFGTAIPFGLTYRQQASWLWEMGGLETMRSYYADNFNLINFPAGSTGVQMGGFFNREINSLADLQGLTMRIPGMGGAVMSEMGVNAQVLGGGEIAQALQTGAIDAAEFVGPYDDNNLGLGEAGEFYYYPGWWEPGATLDVFVSLDAYNELPDSYKTALELAAKISYLDMMAFYDRVQPVALQEIVAQGVELRPFPDDVMAEAKRITEELLDGFAADDPTFAEVLGPWREYRDAVGAWHGTAELSMLQALNPNS